MNKSMNSKLSLFGLLVFSLAMSQGWVDRSNIAEAANLASLAPSNTGKVENVKVDVDGEEVTEDVNFKYEIKNRTTTFGTVNEKVMEASFCSSGSCNTVTFDESQMSDLVALDQLFKEAAKESLLANHKSKKEEEEKKEKLAELQERADKCQIKITDRDKLEFEKLTGSENRSERMDCEVANFKKKEYDSDSKEYAAFRKKFRKDLEKMIFSSDDEEREMALSVLEDMGGEFSNDRIENYLLGLESTHSDYEMLLADTEIIALAENPNSREAMMAQNRITQAMGRYEAQANHYRMASMQGYRFGSGAQSFLDTKAEMVRRMNIATNNPQQLINSSYDSDLDFAPGGQGLRGGRANIGFDQYPISNYTQGLSQPGSRGNFGNTAIGGQQNLNGSCNGQAVPRNRQHQVNCGTSGNRSMRASAVSFSLSMSVALTGIQRMALANAS